MFRAKFVEGLERLWERNELELPPDLGALTRQGFLRWLRPMRRSPWVVYFKPPFAGHRKLLDYLSRYTHRVAISSQRILSGESGQVRFSYRDRSDGDRKKVESLPAEEFIGRFLQRSNACRPIESPRRPRGRCAAQFNWFYRRTSIFPS